MSNKPNAAYPSYPWRSTYWIPTCSAFARSRGRQCRRRVGVRPDGSFYNVCVSHGAKTPPYSERPISAKGKARIGAAARALWTRYRELKSQGLPVWPVGRPKKPTPSPGPAKWQRTETPAARKERIAKLVEAKFPNAKFRDD